jgi:putative FmdB family regulatory protein
MPIYVYKCEKGHITELIQSVKDKPLEICHCGEKVKKQVTKTSFQFKQP